MSFVASSSKLFGENLEAIRSVMNILARNSNILSQKERHICLCRRSRRNLFTLVFLVIGFVFFFKHAPRGKKILKKFHFVALAKRLGELITQLSCCYLVLREMTFIVKTKGTESVCRLYYLSSRKKKLMKYCENIISNCQQVFRNSNVMNSRRSVVKKSMEIVH